MKLLLHRIFKCLADKTDVKNKPIGLTPIPPMISNKRLFTSTINELVETLSDVSVVEAIKVEYIGFSGDTVQEKLIENPDRGVRADSKNEE